MFARFTSPRSSRPPPALVPLMNWWQRSVYWFGAIAWLLALCIFWEWWLRPEHNIDTLRYVMNTLVLAWTTLLPIYFVALLIRARVANPKLGIPVDAAVAMVVTKAPSEPFSVVRDTLVAMLAQDVAHDTWLADEDPTPEVLIWCAVHRVRVSTRRGNRDYHRSTWPRRTRCKEGNLAYFYDHYGYQKYEFVVQMDADHVPEPGYLRAMLRPFADPAVGYVSAPSICDKNAAHSWSARGRLHIEAMLHGLLQAGYSAGWAPLCIGSHYAVRTSALYDIGGLGPELAEDHSTTMIMNAHGWRGVHAFDAIAHGDGPQTFADLVTQEFQWSRSLITILLRHTPQHLSRLPRKLQFQFLFCQLWYPLFALVMLALYAMPVVALATQSRYVDVTAIDFYIHVLAAELIFAILALGWRANGWLRPADAKIFSWEAILFLFARWPWVVAGTIAALCDWYRGATVPFRVTPKGGTRADHVPFRVLLPYALLASISGLAVLALPTVGEARGFYIFAILNCALYAILLAVIVVRHEVENHIPGRAAPRSMHMAGAVATLLLLLPAVGTIVRGPEAVEALVYGTEHFGITTVTYAASGAGRRGERIMRLKIAQDMNVTNLTN
jgi:cellulose synthase (UDP-forming)